nr:hypothetical protein [Tanacetum cinerariifolium]
MALRVTWVKHIRESVKVEGYKKTGTITMKPGHGFPLSKTLSRRGREAALMQFNCVGYEPYGFISNSLWRAERMDGTPITEIDIKRERGLLEPSGDNFRLRNSNFSWLRGARAVREIGTIKMMARKGFPLTQSYNNMEKAAALKPFCFEGVELIGFITGGLWEGVTSGSWDSL